MTQVVVFLRQTSTNRYALFGPKGNMLVEFTEVTRPMAEVMANAWVSSFNGWRVQVEIE